jgi:hypothetical protein
MDWDGTYITDDTLNSIFRKLPQGVLLEAFMDSCHSGTGLRKIELVRPADLATESTLTIYRQPRYLPPPADILARVEGEEEELKPTRRFVDTAKGSTHHILWAGCRSDQTSADAYISGTYNGAFTYFFCKHMRDANGTLSRNELLRRVRQSLVHDGFSQVPQLEMQATVRNVKAFAPVDRKADVKTQRRDGKVQKRSLQRSTPSIGKKAAPPSVPRLTSLKVAK